MKPIYTGPALILLAVILWGCPYSSTVGIDENSTLDINPNLLGTWRKANYPADSTEVIFTKKTDHQYDIIATIGQPATGYEHYNIIGFFSKVNDGYVLNLYNVDDPEYNFAVVELNGDNLNIKLLSDEITDQKFTTTADMRNFIEQLYKAGSVKYDDENEVAGLIRVR
ncbi:MAG TPA: hypothetical protein VET23_03610 [Chitinophagaceae bacterium]|nr:hypothetical protein [Chitinophagaceae bacterium]